MAYHLVENFLDPESYEKLRIRAPLFRKYARLDDQFVTSDKEIDINQGYYEKNIRRNRVWRTRPSGANYNTYIDKSDVSKLVLDFFGEDFKNPLQSAKQFFISKGLNEIILRNMWLQYTDKTSAVHRHVDGKIFSAPIEKSFTALIWCHEYWDIEWGAELKMIVDDQIITLNPKPNTFVAWTRETPHWVTPITEKYNADIHPTRTMLGFSLYQY